MAVAWRRLCGWRFSLTILGGQLLLAPDARCQFAPSQSPVATTFSLGQPPLGRAHFGLAGGGWFEPPGRAVLTRAHVGYYRALANPVIGLVEIGGEAYGGSSATHFDAGGRVLLHMPYLSMASGLDYNLRFERWTWIVSTHTPVRRGGLFRRGTQLRLDWYPAERHSVLLGVTVPVGDPLAGRTRPIERGVRLTAPRERVPDHRYRDAALDAALDSLGASAELVRRLVAPYLDQDGRDRATALRRTRAMLAELRTRLATSDVAAEVALFHARMAQAFALAAGDTAAGTGLARQCRTTLLEEVLLPFDGLLGRQRRGNLDDFGVAARAAFARAVAAGDLAGPARREAVLFAFQRVVQILDDVRRRAGAEWDDPRLVWLPLQYGLLPEEYDEQAELDALVERATRVRFTAGNRIAYLANLAFHWELLRTIRETRDYHVLWIHDFPAITNGRSDVGSLEVTIGYVTALADHAAAYDSIGRLPAYFIFLDQHYYEVRRSRLLMSILEDPLNAAIDLPRATTEQRQRLRQAQQRLRVAVAGSRMLTAEAREYGDAWLGNRIKVHVNITNRPDASFWGGGLIASVFGYPDDVMRDHRKIAFHDVGEGRSDGEAIITGMGVGEAYLGPGWDDRSVMARGPVLLELREAAYQLLRTQGMSDAHMPEALRRPAAAPSDAVVTGDAAAEGRAALLINGTGYLAKPVNVGKAVLYSLAPRGASFRVPDSLWNSTFFASLLAGAALRGARVAIIAPALANAPSSGFPQMVRAYELYERLLLVRRELADALTAAGGELRLGLYALPPDAAGFASRAALWVRRVDSTESLAELRSLLAAVTVAAQSPGADLREPADAVRTPRLHQKVQVMVSAAVWRAIVAAPEWPALMGAYLRHRVATYDSPEAYGALRGSADSLRLIAQQLYTRASAAAPGQPLYAIVGSQNMDYRGMFMDGETGLVFTGAQALVPLADLVFMEGTVTWIEDDAALARLLPRGSELRRRIGRVTKDGL